MSKQWKEKYTLEKASACCIRTSEGEVINRWGESKWIYHVEVLDFQFSFFSLEMLDKYIEYFSLKILPSTRVYDSSPYSSGPAASIGDGQSPFERLPSFLRKKNKKPKVLKALSLAKKEFIKNV